MSRCCAASTWVATDPSRWSDLRRVVEGIGHCRRRHVHPEWQRRVQLRQARCPEAGRQLEAALLDAFGFGVEVVVRSGTRWPTSCRQPVRRPSRPHKDLYAPSPGIRSVATSRRPRLRTGRVLRRAARRVHAHAAGYGGRSSAPPSCSGWPARGTARNWNTVTSWPTWQPAAADLVGRSAPCSAASPWGSPA